MRIKEEINRSGLFLVSFWFLSVYANLPDHSVSGTLSISDEGDIELELAQPLVTDMPGFNLDSFNQILGHVETDRWTYYT